ncbi:MAG: cbb3-type cytochrome c oxidase subunit I [Burkholderiales bacterium]|nr:MAG: cbb3-type cytochrome c oxidase subunit I [Burkholderiales bacterium]
MADALFRTCKVTGLKVNKDAERLVKINAVVAVVAFLIGVIAAITIALTRWQAVHLLDATGYYRMLTVHGLNMLIFFIIFFEMAILYFAGPIALNCRLPAPKMGWAALALMVIGAVMVDWMVFAGKADVLFTSYVPLRADPMYYLGIILFAVGALIVCGLFLATMVVAKREKTYEGSVPLVTFGALTACIIAIFTIASGAIILIPTFLWSIGYISQIDPAMYRVIWWAFGHSSQQINVSAHVAVWYAIAAIVFGAKPMSERVSRTAFLLYIMFLQLASAHHILADPAVGTEWKVFNTSYAMYLAVLASMIHGLTVPGSIEVAQRAKGFTKGLFEWIRKAPWDNPVFSGMFISLIGFGFLGGISGVMMGTEQLNMLIHNTVYVPGHFHATVVVGTTLAFMSLTYFLIPVVFNREMISPNLAKWQPYLFGIGMGVFSLALMGAGTLGVPRRHWDITFAGAALPYEFPGTAWLMLALMGLSGVVAVVGGAIYIYITVGSLLWGRKLDPGAYGTSRSVLPMPVETAMTGHGQAGFAAPGTFVFALVFLAAFVLYYFVNWKYLSTVWGLS